MQLVEIEKVLLIIEEIKENRDLPKNYGTLLDIMRKIRQLPTIDAEPVVHAHWIRKKSTPFSGDNDWECSNCGNGCRLDIGYRPKKYCGDCGAKMDEEVKK